MLLRGEEATLIKITATKNRSSVQRESRFTSLRATQQTLPLMIWITLVLHFMYMGQPLPLSVKYDMAAGAKVHQNIV